MLPYAVKIQYQKGREDALIAQFKELQDAKDFINQKLLKDRSLKLTTTYNIYELGELIEEVSEATDNADQSSSGQSKSQTFRPSPLQTNLRPTGMPISSFIDKEEKDKKST